MARLPGAVAPNSGFTLDWKVPGVTTARARVRVKIFGRRGRLLATDTSDRLFSISRLLAPRPTAAKVE